MTEQEIKLKLVPNFSWGYELFIRFPFVFLSLAALRVGLRDGWNAGITVFFILVLIIPIVRAVYKFFSERNNHITFYDFGIVYTLKFDNPLISDDSTSDGHLLMDLIFMFFRIPEYIGNMVHPTPRLANRTYQAVEIKMKQGIIGKVFNRGRIFLVKKNRDGSKDNKWLASLTEERLTSITVKNVKEQYQIIQQIINN